MAQEIFLSQYAQTCTLSCLAQGLAFLSLKIDYCSNLVARIGVRLSVCF